MRFGGVVAVDDVTSASQERELRCLIGPNGAGKSTFFKCLTGQLRPTGGRVLFARRDIAGLAAARHRPARHRHQDPGADRVRRAHGARECAGRRPPSMAPGRQRRRRADARSTGSASPRRRRAVGPLAHGQRQLVELAMVIAPEPDLIILDEPTAGMTAEETAGTADADPRDEPRPRHGRGRARHAVHPPHRPDRHRVPPGRVLIEDDVAEVLADPRVHDVYLGRPPQARQAVPACWRCPAWSPAMAASACSTAST